MAVNLPVDFEQKVKLPPKANSAGYPYKLSAKDLMLNFKALADQGLPDGNMIGDILEWDGTQWLPVQPEEGETGAGGDTDAADINLGFRQVNIVQGSDPAWVDFTVESTIAKWLYVRNGLVFSDRTKVTTPDDTGTGAGSVYPRIIHLLPIDNTGTAGTALSGTERGGWIEPE